MIAARSLKLDLIVGARNPAEPPWFCPECGEEVHRRQGTRTAAHFAHFPGSTCDYGEGESEYHIRMKNVVGDIFNNCTFELPLSPERRADVVVETESGWPFVVECQVTPIDPRECVERTQDYNNLGYPVLWLWGMANFNSHRSKRPDEYAVRSATLAMHHECDNIIYVVDHGDRLLTTTLGDAHERAGVWVDDDWIDGRTPTTIKRWWSQFTLGPKFDRRPAPIVHETRSGLQVIELGDRQQVLHDAARRNPPFTWDVAPPRADRSDDWTDG